MSKNSLAEVLKKKGAAATKEEEPKTVDDVDAVDEGEGFDVEDVLSAVEGIEVEAVVGGALQRIRLKAGANPAEVLGMLRVLDKDAKVRDDFPRKNFGNRETKTARVVAMNVRVGDSGKFITLIAQNGEDLSVSVSKKSADTFLADVKALDKLSDGTMTKLEAAFEQKKEATAILHEEEQFGVNYWTTDDGKHFAESFTAEPPAAAAEEKAEVSHE